MKRYLLNKETLVLHDKNALTEQCNTDAMQRSDGRSMTLDEALYDMAQLSFAMARNRRYRGCKHCTK